MTNPRLITWTFCTVHLYFDADCALPHATIVPKGTLCGKYPKKRGRAGTWGGISHDFSSLGWDGRHVKWGRMKFCQKCCKEAIRLRMADKMGLLPI